MQEYLSFLQSILQAARDRGWSDSRLSIQLVEDAREPLHVSYAMLTPANGETSLDAIYIGQGWVERFDRGEILARVPTLSEHKTKQLLELVATASALSADLGLPADFINPLTVMAEQLRTNIIEDRRGIDGQPEGDWEVPEDIL